MLSNLADNNNLFSIGKNIGKVKDTLAKDFGIVTNWLYVNVKALDSKKSFQILKNVILCVLAKAGKIKHLILKMCYKNSKEKAILGITIELNFDSNVKLMCKNIF